MNEQHVSDLRWDRHLGGELSAAESTDALAHANGCPRCAARLRALIVERDAFTARPIPIELVRRRPRRAVWIATASALAAAAVVVIVIGRRGGPGTDENRTKGSGAPSLVLAAGTPPRLAPVATGDAIHPGDSLQATYTAARDGFGAVLSRDGAGTTASYVPSAGDAMIALPAGTDRSYPESTVLDQVLGSETIVLVWCEAAQALAPLVAQLRATGDVTAPTGCHARRVVLDKR